MEIFSWKLDYKSLLIRGEVGLEINTWESGKGRRWNPESFQTLVTYRKRSQKSKRKTQDSYRSQTKKGFQKEGVISGISAAGRNMNIDN